MFLALDFFEEDYISKELESIITFIKKHLNKHPILRLENYVEKVIPSYDDLQFKSHFRYV